MDYLKLPKLNFSIIAMAIALGVVTAILVYLAQSRNLIPSLGTSSRSPSLEIRTVVQEENTIISVIEKAGPSIVTIGPGIGFIVDSKGLIVTNKQIVSGVGPYNILTEDGQKYEAKKIYRDPNSDLSLIQIDATNLKALELGESSKIKLGQTAIVLGRKEQSINASVGVVSALGNLIQTDAKISQENSGGPVLSSAGQVIGVQASGSAIPSSYIKQFIDESIVSGKPYLGLKYQFVSNGALVQEVIDGGPASLVGIKSGDLITKVDGQVVDSETKISQLIAGKKIGDSLKLTVLNARKERSVTATLQMSPNQ